MMKPQIVSLTYADPPVWPQIPGLSPEAAAIPLEVIWRRIEYYTGDVYWPRAFVLKLEIRYRPVHIYGVPDGEQEGYFKLPVSNPQQVVVEANHGKGWWTNPDPVFVDGAAILSQGSYRISGVAGYLPHQLPQTVMEAARRFAEYTASIMQRPADVPAGVESYSINLGGDVSESYRFSRKGVADAMIASGAADLLRPYRRRR